MTTLGTVRRTVDPPGKRDVVLIMTIELEFIVQVEEVMLDVHIFDNTVILV